MSSGLRVCMGQRAGGRAGGATGPPEVCLCLCVSTRSHLQPHPVTFAATPCHACGHTQSRSQPHPVTLSPALSVQVVSGESDVFSMAVAVVVAYLMADLGTGGCVCGGGGGHVGAILWGPCGWQRV